MSGVPKSKELNFNVRNIFAGSHTEHGWSCSTSSLQKGKRETEEDRERESFTLINADKSTDETQPKKQTPWNKRSLGP
jgi:hypothetical protein